MNTITHEGNDYEVLDPLTTESQSATHAKTAEGIMSCKFIQEDTPRFRVGSSSIYFKNMTQFGIQPLKLLEKVPVEFVGEVSRIDGGNYYVDTINVPVTVEPGMKFRCVEIVEVTK